MSIIRGKFFTVKKDYGPEEIKEKGSRFISFLYPVKSKEEANKIKNKLKKKFFDATHICFAYRLGEGTELYYRLNDDGEPNGTAGLPIYNEIKKRDYFNVMVAVVRYFGGIKLGTGGLARSYKQSAKRVLDVSKEVEVYIRREISISFSYNFMGEMRKIINFFSIDIINQDYSEKGVNMKLGIPITKFDEVSKKISDKSNGKIKLIMPG